MSELRVQARIPRKLKEEYQRSCQLLGISMTARLHQAIRTTVRKAKTEYPHAFNRLNEDAELVLEAVEEQCTTVLDIQMYTRYDKVRVQELLRGLIERGHVREVRGEYTVIRKPGQ